MKKLLIIAYYYPPINSSGVHRTLSFIKYLPKDFWKISVITVKLKSEFEYDCIISDGLYDDVKIYRTKCIDYFYLWKKLKRASMENRLNKSSIFKTSNIVTSGYLQRFKNQISALLQTPDNQAGWLFPTLLRCTMLPRPDVIYSTAPPFTALVIATFLKKMWGVPLIADFRDPWSGNPFNIVHGGMATWINNLLEKILMNRADSIIANTDLMAKNLIFNFPEKKNNIHVITNGYDPEECQDIEPLRSFDKNTLLLIHIGLLYEQRNPLPFLQAVKNIVTDSSFCDQIKVQLIGSSESFKGQTVEELVQHLDLTHVVDLVSTVSHQEALARAKGADVLLLFAQGTLLQIPAKLFEYFAIGTPILAVCEEGSATQEMLSSMDGHQVATRNLAADIELCIRNLHIGWQQEDGNSQRRGQVIEKLSRRKLARDFENILMSHSGA